MNSKSKYRESNKFFNKLPPLIKSVLPKDNEMVKNTYEAKKSLKGMGLGHKNIQACINDCIFYMNNYSNLNKCPIYEESRWKVEKQKKKKRVL